MKKLLNIFFLIILSIGLKAEYGAYYLKITIETTNGKINKGYSYIGDEQLNLDSINNPGYVKKALNNYNTDNPDSLVYYKHRLGYQAKKVQILQIR